MVTVVATIGARPGEPPMPGFTYFSCILVVSTDAEGEIRWAQTFGEPLAHEGASSINQTACGGFIIAGHTGLRNVWLIKLAPEQ